MRIVMFDLSLTCTGWAAGTTDEDGAITVDYGCLVASPTGVRRLADLQARVWELSEGADLCGVEDYAYHAKGAHSHELGELGGVIRLTWHKRGMPWCAVNPTILKTYATGKGNAPKDLVLVEAVKRLGYGGASKDEADALWLCALAFDHYGHPYAEVPQSHRKSLHKVAWPTLEERCS